MELRANDKGVEGGKGLKGAHAHHTNIVTLFNIKFSSFIFYIS